MLTYDSTINDEDLQDNEYADKCLKNKIRLKLIDFAHTTFGPDFNGPDNDLLIGIQNLTKCLLDITEDTDLVPLVPNQS